MHNGAASSKNSPTGNIGYFAPLLIFDHLTDLLFPNETNGSQNQPRRIVVPPDSDEMNTPKNRTVSLYDKFKHSAYYLAHSLLGALDLYAITNDHYPMISLENYSPHTHCLLYHGSRVLLYAAFPPLRYLLWAETIPLSLYLIFNRYVLYRGYQESWTTKWYLPFQQFYKMNDTKYPRIPNGFIEPPLPKLNQHQKAAWKRKITNTYIDTMLGNDRFDVASNGKHEFGIQEWYFPTDTASKRKLPTPTKFEELARLFGHISRLPVKSLVFVDTFHYLKYTQLVFWASHFVPMVFYVDAPVQNVGMDSEGYWYHKYDEKNQLCLCRHYNGGETYLDVQYNWHTSSFVTFEVGSLVYCFRKIAHRLDNSHILIILLPTAQCHISMLTTLCPLKPLTGDPTKPIIRQVTTGRKSYSVSISVNPGGSDPDFKHANYRGEDFNKIYGLKNDRAVRSVAAVLATSKSTIARKDMDDRPVDEELAKLDSTVVSKSPNMPFYQEITTFAPSELTSSNLYSVDSLQLFTYNEMNIPGGNLLESDDDEFDSDEEPLFDEYETALMDAQMDTINPFYIDPPPQPTCSETAELGSFHQYCILQDFDALVKQPDRTTLHFGANIVHPMFAPAKVESNLIWAHTRRYLKCTRVIDPDYQKLYVAGMRRFATLLKETLVIELQATEDSLTQHKQRVNLEYTRDFSSSKGPSCVIFSKEEFYTEPKDPRVISNVDPATNMLLLPFQKALHDALAEHPETTWYMPGRAGLEYNPNHIDLDVSRNDGSHTLLHRLLEVEIFRELFGDEAAKAVSREIMTPFTIPYGDRMWYMPAMGSRKSGSQLTSLMNTLIHAYMQWLYYTTAGYSDSEAFRQIAPGYGDDQKFNGLHAEAYVDFCIKLGFKLTYEPHGLCDHNKFLGKLWCEDAAALDPERIVPKCCLAFSSESRTVAFINKWSGYYAGPNAPPCPIFGLLGSFCVNFRTDDVLRHHYSTSKWMSLDLQEEIWDAFDPEWRQLHYLIESIVEEQEHDLIELHDMADKPAFENVYQFLNVPAWDEDLNFSQVRQIRSYVNDHLSIFVERVISAISEHYFDRYDHYFMVDQAPTALIDETGVATCVRGSFDVVDVTEPFMQYLQFKILFKNRYPYFGSNGKHICPANKVDASLLLSYVKRFGKQFGISVDFEKLQEILDKPPHLPKISTPSQQTPVVSNTLEVPPITKNTKTQKPSKNTKTSSPKLSDVPKVDNGFGEAKFFFDSKFDHAKPSSSKPKPPTRKAPPPPIVTKEPEVEPVIYGANEKDPHPTQPIDGLTDLEERNRVFGTEDYQWKYITNTDHIKCANGTRILSVNETEFDQEYASDFYAYTLDDENHVTFYLPRPGTYGYAFLCDTNVLSYTTDTHRPIISDADDHDTIRALRKSISDAAYAEFLQDSINYADAVVETATPSPRPRVRYVERTVALDHANDATIERYYLRNPDLDPVVGDSHAGEVVSPSSKTLISPLSPTNAQKSKKSKTKQRSRPRKTRKSKETTGTRTDRGRSLSSNLSTAQKSSKTSDDSGRGGHT
jgi:hypothetical protein